MGEKPYEQKKPDIHTDKPENASQSREKGPQSDERQEMVTFSIRLPKEQKERLERFLIRQKGIPVSTFVRQLITEYMVKEKLW